MAEDSSDAAPMSFGNYKGVMLCNRPFAGAAEVRKQGTSGSAGPKGFVAGIRTEITHPRGWDPSVKERINTVAVRSNKDTALSKHKKWLKDLQKQREVLKEQALAKAAEAEEKQRQFQETQKRVRLAIQGTLEDDAIESGAQPSKPAAKPAGKAKGAGKPAWAYTEESKAAEEDAEAEALLEFAQTLDYDKFVEDMEVRSALDHVKHRIDELEAEEREAEQAQVRAEREARIEAARARGRGEDEWEEVEEEVEEEVLDEDGNPQIVVRTVVVRKLKPKRPAALTDDNLSALGGREYRDSDEVSVADTIMTTASSIRNVHSKRSLNKVIDSVKRENTYQPLPPVREGPVELPAVQAPKITVIQEDGGTRLNKAKDPSNLPYLNRNPAL